MHHLKSDWNCTCLCMWLVWFYALIFLILAHCDWRFIWWISGEALGCTWIVVYSPFNMSNTFQNTCSDPWTVKEIEKLKHMRHFYMFMCVSLFENVISIPSPKSKRSISILVQCCIKFSIWFSQQKKSERTTYMMLYMISYEANFED